MLVDDLLAEIGLGKTQIIVFVALCWPTFPNVWHLFVTNFIGDLPEFYCKQWNMLRESDFGNSDFVNVSTFASSDVSLLPTLRNLNYSERKYVNLHLDDQCDITLNRTQYTCSEWLYVDDHSSFVSQFDLVCDRTWMIHLSSTVIMAGDMVAVLLGPTLSDMFGRKPVNLLSTWLFLLFGLANTLTSNYVVYLVLRFIVGFIKTIQFYSGYTLMCEWFPPNRRSIPGCANMLFWAGGVMSLPGLMYLVPHWRLATIIITVPLATTLLYPLFLPESPHWYYAQGHFGEAEEVLKKAASWNNVVLSRTTLDNIKSRPKLKETSKKSTKTSMIDVARTPMLRMYAGLLCLPWFMAALVYYGLTLSTSVLVGNKYWNCFFLGLVEVPAYLSNVFLLHIFGRRIPLCIYQFGAGVSLLIIFFIPHTTSSGVDMTSLITVLTLIGKTGVTAVSGGLHLLTAEIYPTVVRNAGLGFSVFISRISSTLSPFAIYLIGGDRAKLFLMFGICGLVGASVFFCLPETANAPLTETLDEFHGSKKRLKDQCKDENEMTTML